MRFFLFGRRILGVRPGISFGPEDFRPKRRASFSGGADTALDKPAFAYVIRGDYGRCKVGKANNPIRRLKELQTGSPAKLSFAYIGATDSGDASSIEAEAHAILDRYRGAGEWFTCPVELAVAAINGAAVKLGEQLVTVDPSRVEELITRALKQINATAQQHKSAWKQISKRAYVTIAIGALLIYSLVLLLTR